MGIRESVWFFDCLPISCFDNFVFLLNCFIVFWSVYIFMSVIFIDNFAALLTVVLSPSLLCIFCLMMILCFMNVIAAWMHISIC